MQLEGLEYDVLVRRDIGLFLDLKGIEAWMVGLDRHITDMGRKKLEAEKAVRYITSVTDYHRRHPSIIPTSGSEVQDKSL